MTDKEQNKVRSIPTNELDFNMQLTKPSWGKDEISKKAQEQMTKVFYLYNPETGEIERDDDGNPIVHNEEDYWAKLGMFTQDWRLSYLDQKDYKVCCWYSEQAQAYTQIKAKKSIHTCLGQIATRLELSQSKNGNLRDSLNTLIQKNLTTNEEPAKKSLFGFGGKK